MGDKPIAYLEAGHAVVATVRGWRVSRISIVPRNGLLGCCDVVGNSRCIDTAFGGPGGQAICSECPNLSLTHHYCKQDRDDALDMSTATRS
jgi:hypothetical protein